MILVLAVLATLAIPGYRQTLVKTRRGDAVKALLDAASRQELFMLRHGTYTADMRDLGFSERSLASEQGHYTVEASACSEGSLGTCYLLTARPRQGSSQTGDVLCTSMSLDSYGRRSATGSDTRRCW